MDNTFRDWKIVYSFYGISMLTSEDCISTRDVNVIATAYKKSNPFEVKAAREMNIRFNHFLFKIT